MTIAQQRHSLLSEHLRTLGVKRLVELVPYQFKVLWVCEPPRYQEMVKGVSRIGSFNYLCNVHRGRFEKNRGVVLRFFKGLEKYDIATFREVLNELD